MPSSPPLLSLSDIATLARVQRPVVSTWRRRYPDFPAPVAERGNRTWFDGRTIADWLTTTGLGNTPAGEIGPELVAHGLVRLAEEIGVQRLVSVLGALLCLHHMDEKPLADITEDALLDRVERMDPEDEFFRRELVEDPALSARLAPLAEELVEAAYTPGGAHEHLMAHRHRLGLTGPDTGSLSPGLRRLIVRVADPLGRVRDDGTLTVADPHALCGDLLHDVVAALDDPSDTTALAAERSAFLARLTRRRLELSGVPELGLDVQEGDELEERLADPDLIVTTLPYQAGESRSRARVLEEVESIGDLLGEGCTAVVVGPADALVGELDAREAQIRSRLLRSGLVESVTTLPGGADPYRPGYGCAMWTLTREPVSAARGRVLISDIGARSLESGVGEALAEDILLWRREGHHLGGHDPRYGLSVTVKDLEERFGAPLVPPGPPVSRILSRTARDRPALIAEAEARLSEAESEARSHADARGPLRGGLVRRVGPAPERVTVGNLVRQKRIVPVKGHRIAAEHIEPRGQFPVLGPDEVLGRAPRDGRWIDQVVFAVEYPHAALTEPGDVVYTTGPEFGAMIDHEGSSVVAFPARILRVNCEARRALTPRVLTLLLEGASSAQRPARAVRAPRGVGEIALPDLHPEEVARLDAVLAGAERRRALLDEQYAELDTIRRLSSAGFSDGTLAVPTT
ncbi:hypothetical protein Q8791_00915 [Nocardiopsis sp. CT-R113]|uniref:DNA methylase adenine-specific domain-containing protein n=1 Tax=Nocardiopsis codii TaxID=3065942 RepID=A0ABU7K0J2_9ACTN|nr:hypothetical protein [Nocardiopsis sp. CT-R113]MEE2035781.1 hypothetical protein [Nocardiopsis sp. CT-R113]